MSSPYLTRSYRAMAEYCHWLLAKHGLAETERLRLQRVLADAETKLSRLSSGFQESQLKWTI